MSSETNIEEQDKPLEIEADRRTRTIFGGRRLADKIRALAAALGLAAAPLLLIETCEVHVHFAETQEQVGQAE